MNLEMDHSLSRAYELIEEDRLDEARNILKPILENNKDNADAWWLYAHAVTDADTAHLALTNVQRIDPSYPEVNDLVRNLEKQREGDDWLSEGGEPSFLPPVPSTLPGFSRVDQEKDGEEWAAFDDAPTSETAFWRRPVFLLATGLLFFLVVSAIVILRPFSQPESVIQTATPNVVLNTTPQMDTNTALPSVIGETSTPLPSLTEENGINAPDFSALYGFLREYEVLENGIETKETTLGNTILVNVCTQPGREMRETLLEVMNTLITQVDMYSAEYQAIGAKMLDCGNANAPILVVAASTNDMSEYAKGDISQTEFESRWQPVG